MKQTSRKMEEEIRTKSWEEKVQRLAKNLKEITKHFYYEAMHKEKIK